MQNNKQGFTLIELLVVVLIIGILSAIALPQYTTAVEKSRAAEALINLKHAQQARILDYVENGSSSDSLAQDIMELSGGKWNEEGMYYCTKQFFYDFENSGYVFAERCTPKEDCSSCQNGSSQYSLEQHTPLFGADWEDDKFCWAYTDLGYKICQGLLGQGFTTQDSR